MWANINWTDLLVLTMTYISNSSFKKSIKLNWKYSQIYSIYASVFLLNFIHIMNSRIIGASEIAKLSFIEKVNLSWIDALNQEMIFLQKEQTMKNIWKNYESNLNNSRFTKDNAKTSLKPKFNCYNKLKK